MAWRLCGQAWVLLFLVMLGAGCSGAAKPCETVDDCGEGQQCIEKRCFVVSQCSEVCQEHEWCSAGACAPRFSAVQVVRPAPDGWMGIEARIDAEVKLTRDAPAEFPHELTWVVLDEVGTQLASGVLASLSDGRYSGTWAAPLEGEFRLRVSHEPAALTSEEVRFRTDLEAPTVTLTIPKPTRPDTTAELSWIDPEPGYSEAWRRDEKVVVTLGSDSPDVAVSSFAVGVKGIGSGEETMVPATASSGCGKALCAQAEVDLAAPEMRAFRGTFELRGVVRDRAENGGTAGGALKVTRWRWKRALQGRPMTPLIGHRGTTYWELGDTPEKAAGVLALDPLGRPRWRKMFTTELLVDLMVGASGLGGDTLYVLHDSSSQSPRELVLSKIRESDGSVERLCAWPDAADAMLLGPDPLSAASSTLVDPLHVLLMRPSGVFRLVSVRPGTPVRCEESVLGNSDSSLWLAGLSSDTLVVGTQTQLSGFRLGEPDFTSSPAFAVPADIGVYLAMSDTHAVVILGTGAGIVLRWIRLSDGLVTDVPVFEGVNPPLFSEDGRAVTSGDGPPGHSILSRHTPDGATDVITVPGESVSLAVGAGGTIYAAGTTALTAVGSNFEKSWTTSISNLDFISLDCARTDAGKPDPGRPGTLYGRLAPDSAVSIVTDSRGLSSRSTWPIRDRDARRSRNASQLVEVCP